MKSLEREYDERRDELLELCDGLERFLRENIVYPRIDRISCRVKSTESFIAKASKTDGNGNPKYIDPLNEIQDQVGARIVTFYRSDVHSLAQSVDSLLRRIERKHHLPEMRDQFGYEGLHYILFFPHELIPNGLETSAPRFFELQIKTLFQHAWSEAEHDLGYKGRTLSTDNQRKLAFTAAQAWGADLIFGELFEDTISHVTHGNRPSA